MKNEKKIKVLVADNSELLLLKKQMETEVLRKNRYLLLFPLWEINQW